MNEIAYAWGFSDPTHIGRRFKKMFGRLPSEVREPENAGSASNLRNALMRKQGQATASGTSYGQGLRSNASNGGSNCNPRRHSS